MKLTSDYHTHTIFSHGKGTIRENVEQAKKLGLLEIGITDHGFGHPAFGLTRKKVPIMREEVELAKKELGVNVLLGVEANLLGEDGYVDIDKWAMERLDLFLMGSHRFVVYKKIKDYFYYFGNTYIHSKLHISPSANLVKTTTNAFIKAIERYPIDAITHINFGVFTDAVEVAKACRDYGTYLELNSKKVHLTDDELEKVATTGVRFIIDSDAHTVDRVGEISLVTKTLERINFPLDKIDNIDGRLPAFRFKAFKKTL